MGFWFDLLLLLLRWRHRKWLLLNLGLRWRSLYDLKLLHLGWELLRLLLLLHRLLGCDYEIRLRLGADLLRRLGRLFD